MNREFSLLWTGQTVSQLGNEAFSVSMMLWLMVHTGSATIMGLLMAASMLPGVLLSPIGGTLADRCSRIRIVIWSDLLAGLGIGIVALLFWLRPADTHLLVTGLFFAAILLGVIRGFFQPAIFAAVPYLVKSEGRAAANSLNEFSAHAARFGGQAIGGAFFGFLGAPGLFLVDAVSFLFAGGAESFIPRDKPLRTEDTSDTHPFRTFARETASGFRWLWAQRGLRVFVLGASIINFLTTPVTLVFPFFVKTNLGLGPGWYGLFMAAFSLGSVAAFLFVSTVRLSGVLWAWSVLASLVVHPVCFLVLAFVRTPAQTALTLLVGGVAVGLINIYIITLLQGATPSALLGRVMGLLGALSGGLMPLGKAIGGVLADLTQKNAPLIFLWGSGSALTVAVFVIASRQCWGFLAAFELR